VERSEGGAGQLVHALCLKLLSVSLPNMTAGPKQTVRTKAPRLACCNADGVHGKKQELDHFLGQYGIEI
jgi:hypothetical protein